MLILPGKLQVSVCRKGTDADSRGAWIVNQPQGLESWAEG